ncbi:uncharacterized protein N7482_001576 [Penicillium canariense]|uniref:ATP-grasp domain-containing protein n=1 Tax=Penicillium canariense TaxID=189055 RepID=A0A9W9LU12_9EURO|nr:uncharacterized protein N7482_001576 [Penicillium canariense]KAJ5175699.1 hypothetical protein N7482_001576 [Penicillium canariense]
MHHIGNLAWDATATAQASRGSWVSLDLLLRPIAATDAGSGSNPDNVLELNKVCFDAKAVASTPAFQFLRECLVQSSGAVEAAVEPTDRKPVLVKLILPAVRGQITRTDIFQIRLADLPHIALVRSFAQPLQQFEAVDISTVDATHYLETLLVSAAAGLLVSAPEDAQSSYESLSTSIEPQLTNRLSSPWLLDSPQPRRTIALVHAGHIHPEEGGNAAILLNAAKCLGINVVVFDEAGHWLQGPEYAHLRMDFIPIEMPESSVVGFGDHLVQVFNSCGHKIDGATTYCEWYMPAVAEACQALGLPTNTPEAFTIATDKFETSTLAGHLTFRGQTLEDALKFVNTTAVSSNPQNPSHATGPWPLIIKPCKGWSSEGVEKVNNETQLARAIASIDTSRHGDDFLLEPYCNGPEVDVNIVFWEGEIVFFEVCDDFPKPSDDAKSQCESSCSFLEQNSIYPSSHAPGEIDMLQKSCRDTLRRMGFHSGVFHTELRISNSGSEFRQNADGCVDLLPRLTSPDSTSSSPAAWLHEVNPRPPGSTTTKIIESTYGVEYWGLALLTALGDGTRIRALAQPYLDGPQYHCVMVFISNDYDQTLYKGIYDSDDFCADLLSRYPHYRQHLSNYMCFLKKGDHVPHPSTGENVFIGYLNVYSRRSRVHALELAAEVRSKLRINWK